MKYGCNMPLHAEERGDYDYGGDVGGDDYYGWRVSFGDDLLLHANGNGDGSTDGVDYVNWRKNLGRTAGSRSGADVNATVPEAATLGADDSGGGWLVSPATPACIESTSNSLTSETRQQSTVLRDRRNPVYQMSQAQWERLRVFAGRSKPGGPSARRRYYPPSCTESKIHELRRNSQCKQKHRAKKARRLC
jgi:hypothetical protein